ncbi:UBP1-associated protein 2A-like [Dioscorea cayenensis subsp. rotundata]|uniref:UBP1-associated protein 2A-like n=1 Tax=Dioscorea cayennensis subsp. rotundata TaxID=55577 RepID=A0AB40AJZ8_DIOCR|nr:UBP1-associated protein 2A-like [Dioscorea cayenensis subsp. rotundata]XP_039115322.1 UBP1-associated protein 2A-like [Dioscorea cayenensis subsp. rotundata]
MAKKRKLDAKSDPKAASGGGNTTQPSAVEEPINDPMGEEDHQEESMDGEGEEEEEEEEEEPQDHQTLETPDSDNEGDDADAEECDPAAIQKLLEPFPKDQLVELLREAAVNHPDVLSSIYRLADADPAHRKIFVHGLGWETTAETLISAFKQYGEIEDCKAVIDKVSGKSKGYGFILFKHRAGAQRALKEPQKKIGHRTAACQLASAGPPSASTQQQAPSVSEYTQRKIYVSNVGADLEPQKLLQFFSSFGEIEDGPLGLDKASGKPKGFCLFVYRTVEGARKALQEPHKNFEGIILHCQKAIDGPKPGKPVFPSGGGHHGGFHHGGASHGPQFSRTGSASSVGHLMAPPATGLSFNQGNPQAALAAGGLNPALGQALTALIATQGGGLGGLTNLLGSLGSAGIGNQGAGASLGAGGGHGMLGAYGNQPATGGNLNAGVLGGYGAHGHMQGGYGNAGAGGTGRNQPGAGHMGGPYH